MHSKLFMLTTSLLCLFACGDDDDNGHVLEPGICGDGILNVGEACDVPGDSGCDAACHLTDTVAWTVKLGEPGVLFTYPQDVAVGPDGTAYVLGFRWGGGSLPDDGEGWLAALDPAGAELWRIETPTPGGGEGVYPSRVGVAADGAIYVQGFDLSSYAADGSLRWTDADPLVDPRDHLRTATALVVAGDAVFTASYGIRELNPNGPSPTDASLRRHDPATGEVVWERILADDGILGPVYTLALTGTTLVGAGLTGDTFDAGFAFGCAEAVDGASVPCVPDVYTYVTDLAATPDGGIIMTGGLDDREFVRRVSLEGTVAWELPITSDIGAIASVAVGPEGTIVLAGHLGNLEPRSISVRALDGDGTTAWFLEIAPQGEETSVQASAVAFGPGFLVVTGMAAGPGADETTWVRRIGPNV
jgi:hypothetical protein